MPQATPQHSPQDARDELQSNIRKTVAVSTLRRIRGLVDDYDEEERLKARSSRRVAIGGVLVVIGLAAAVYFSGAALPRFVTGLLGLVKG